MSGKVVFERTGKDTCIVKFEGKIPENVMREIRKEMVSTLEIPLEKAVELFLESQFWSGVSVEIK
jgi:hypothetical protein